MTMIASGVGDMIGGGLSIIQAMQGSNVKADIYNSEVAANNAQIAAWERQQTEMQYSAQKNMIATQGASKEGAMEEGIRASQATAVNNAGAGGGQVSGSTADAIYSSTMNQERSRLQENYRTQLSVWQNQTNANTSSYNDLVKQTYYQNESVMDQYKANVDKETNFFNEVGGGLKMAAGLGEIIGGAMGA